jgi:hypothetical protein
VAQTISSSVAAGTRTLRAADVSTSMSNDALGMSKGFCGDDWAVGKMPNRIREAGGLVPHTGVCVGEGANADVSEALEMAIGSNDPGKDDEDSGEATGQVGEAVDALVVDGRVFTPTAEPHLPPGLGGIAGKRGRRVYRIR